MVLELMLSISHKFPRKLKTEWLERYPGIEWERCLDTGWIVKRHFFADLKSPDAHWNAVTISRDTNKENQKQNEDRFQNDPHLELDATVKKSRLIVIAELAAKLQRSENFSRSKTQLNSLESKLRGNW